MRLVNITLLSLAVMAVTVPALQAQSQDVNEGKPSFDRLPITCIRQIPDTIRTAVNQEIVARIKSASLSQETTRILKDTIIALDIEKPAANAEHREKIIQVGTASIPVIAEMLLSQDEKARNSAILALSYLQPLPHSGVTESAGDQNLRIMLLRIGALDKSPTVRRNAIRYLARIGYANPRNIPEGVLAGIESATEDPDARLRRIAETEKEALAVAAEVAQTCSEEDPGSIGASGPSQADGK